MLGATLLGVVTSSGFPKALAPVFTPCCRIISAIITVDAYNLMTSGKEVRTWPHPHPSTLHASKPCNTRSFLGSGNQPCYRAWLPFCRRASATRGFPSGLGLVRQLSCPLQSVNNKPRLDLVSSLGHSYMIVFAHGHARISAQVDGSMYFLVVVAANLIMNHVGRTIIAPRIF